MKVSTRRPFVFDPSFFAASVAGIAFFAWALLPGVVPAAEIPEPDSAAAQAASSPVFSGPLSPEQVVDLRKARSVVLSGDGARAVYVLDVARGVEEEYGPAHQEIWTVPFSGGPARPLTHAPGRTTAPALSPDGETLAFLAKRGEEEHTQIYILPLSGGEARRLTAADSSVASFSWSPDSKALAYLAVDPVSSARKEDEKKGRDWLVADALQRPRRLWRIDVATGTAQEITTDSSSVWHYAWFPDGSRLALTVSQKPDIDSTFTLRLLTQLRIRGMSYQTRSDFEGFWVEKEFDYVDNPPGRISGTQTTVEGEPFSDYLLARLALFPTASGEVRIDPINLQVQVRADRSDSFGSFFFDRDRSIFRRSSPLSVTVLPLPQEGRPASFTGAVGDYRLEVSIDRTESRVNDAVSLRVNLTGVGQIRTAGEPSLPALVDFRTFDPTVEESGSFQEGELVGSRSWEYVLVPLAPGAQSIPPVVFSYFDPAAAAYRTLRSDPVPLQIARADGPEIPMQPGLARRAVTQLQQDIAFIKLPSGELRNRSGPFHRSGAYLALLAMPFVLNGALLAWKVRGVRLQADVGRRRWSGAPRTFRRAMRLAESSRTAGEVTAFHAGIYAALTGLVADRENLAAAGLTRPRLHDILKGAGVDGVVRQEMERILDACDAARFAPGAVDETAMRKLAERATAVARQLQESRR